LSGKKRKNAFSGFIKFLCLIIAFVLVFIPVSIGIIVYFNSSPAQSSSLNVYTEVDGIRKAEDGAYYIEIRRGESSQSVGLRLERAGLIRNRYFWNLICRWEKEFIKTGTYRLETPMAQMAIHRQLVSGRQVLYRVTIPEGVTLRKTAMILEEAGICSASDFLAAAGNPAIINQYRVPNSSMEGYLFPDTYMFPAEYPAEKVVIAMADNFYKKIESIDPSVINLSTRELNEKVILASIIEREYRVSDEAPVMAGVFYNRLRINMALQSCATVEYIITEIQGKPHPRVIYNQDLEIQNPYNTYIRAGLPPGPISAPGTIALRASFFPEKTDYFYFRLINAESGRHTFSRTFDEHLSAGQLFTKSQS
jgi:UPF0755 protein